MYFFGVKFCYLCVVEVGKVWLVGLKNEFVNVDGVGCWGVRRVVGVIWVVICVDEDGGECFFIVVFVG